ncbi:hypothetical protein LR48_Vigan10g178500 [Vigna angularis]|uniref:Uncharacterized protein n=1 Tax=Phaseolus angularis TaxID=3914 RepID=A0A0L9VLM8_PHAAN|nr:hypothetical protein LR48_Vigan10g178500 [Vigna angularis]
MSKELSPSPETLLQPSPQRSDQETENMAEEQNGFKVNLVKEVKKDRAGIRKELKKCKRREAASTAQRLYCWAALRNTRWLR